MDMDSVKTRIEEHKEFYHDVKEKAEDELESLTGCEVESKHDAREALAYALKHGTCDEVARAIMYTTKLMHAHLELEEDED